MDYSKIPCNVILEPRNTGRSLFAAVAQEAVRPNYTAIDKEVVLKHDMPIFNQGYKGSCVGFAYAGGVLKYEYTLHGIVRKDLYFSPVANWISAKEVDRDPNPSVIFQNLGITVYSFIRWWNRFGLITESSVNAEGESNADPYTVLDEARAYSTGTAYRLALDIDTVKAWVTAKHMLGLTLELDQQFFNPNKVVLSNWAGGKDGMHGYHAVALDGYDSVGPWIRNSWGTDWKEGGRAHMTWEYFIASVREIIGVVV